ASRRKNADTQSACVPTFERRSDIREYLRLQSPIFITLPPNLSLQRLQARRLTICGYQPFDVISNQRRRILTFINVIRMFVAQECDICTHFFLVSVIAQKLTDVIASVGE